MKIYSTLITELYNTPSQLQYTYKSEKAVSTKDTHPDSRTSLYIKMAKSLPLITMNLVSKMRVGEVYLFLQELKNSFIVSRKCLYYSI